MPPLPRDPAARCTAVAMIRMTPVQKAKLNLLGSAHEGGVSALVRSWLDAQPMPGATPTAATKPRGVDATPSIPEPAARFVELDPNA